MINVLLTGANGQLGTCLQKKVNQFPKISLDAKNSSELNLLKFDEVEAYFQNYQPDFCVNTGAYTQVDLAEGEAKKAFSINAEAVEHLAKMCAKYNCKLIHISTDYVFDGKKKSPYLETDLTGPINAYGASKLAGEKAIETHLEAHYILRTSWLYSDVGKNFFTSMKNLLKKGTQLKIVTSQKGCPTNAYHLAEVILKLIEKAEVAYGIYHFSNSEATTWYAFTKEIARLIEVDEDLVLPTQHYPTKAERPENSVLSCAKIENALGYKIADWKTALSELK